MADPVVVTSSFAQFNFFTGSLCSYTFEGSWFNNFDGYETRERNLHASPFTIHGWFTGTGSTASSGGWNSTSAIGGARAADIPIDSNFTIVAQVRFIGYGFVNGSTLGFKSQAFAASASAPTVAVITANSAFVSCNYIPNVTASTSSAQLQYKRTVDSTWNSFGAPKTDGTGYGTVSILFVPLTGLLSSTSYDVRLVVTRTTVNDTVVTGSASSFVTLPGEAEVVTNAASGVAATTAQLNATVTRNAGTNVQVFWKWGTDNPPTMNTTASQAVPSDGSYSVGITGLIGSTTYFAQAFVTFDTPSGSPNEGLVVSFMTPVNPAAVAAEEDHMHIYEYDGQFGIAKTVYFTLQSPAGTSSDRLVTTAPGSLFAAGDIKLSKDGGAFANVVNAVVQVAASNPLYSLTLTAAEQQAEDLVVQIVDLNGPAFRDAFIHVRTKLKIGQIDVDATQLTNASALKLQGQGTGHGLEAIGGATGMDYNGIMAEHFQRVSVCQTNVDGTKVKLDAGASATNDYYNGSIVMIVGGTGAGQARVIIDYDGTTKEATVDSSFATIPTAGSIAVLFGGDRTWDLTPAAELAAVPGSTASYGLKLQFLFQRFAFKIIQTATLQTWFKANSSTTLASRSVDDDGVTQTLAKLT
jgi:hypothetical protein